MNSRNSNNNTEEKFLAANALVANIPLIKKIVTFKENYAYSFQKYHVVQFILQASSKTILDYKA